MLLIHNRNITDPHINLALEEYAVRHLEKDESCLIFYVNEPSVIVGRNQNTIEEINERYIRERGIHVVRRVSGGGAVYHDQGNLNFSFITNLEPGRRPGFEEFTRPIVQALQGLGLPATLTGRNDIVVGKRKISGNAQFTAARRMFSHGTLLFATDLDAVESALSVAAGKIESKGLKSVRSRVANIGDLLPESLTIEEFRARLLASLYPGGNPPVYELSTGEWERVHDLANEKYRQWQWNYGRSPAFNLQRKKRFAIGEVDLRLDIQKGLIDNVKIYGDFLGRGDVNDLESSLRGVPYSQPALERVVETLNVEEYFGGLTKAELLDLLSQSSGPLPK